MRGSSLGANDLSQLLFVDHSSQRPEQISVMCGNRTGYTHAANP